MKDAKTAVLFDLDNTISDATHRTHLLPPLNPESTWEAYSGACGDDLPIKGTLAAMSLHYPHHQVHIISGRSSSVLDMTQAWLEKYDAQYDVLRLRQPSDVRHATGAMANAMFKVDYIRQLRMYDIEVLLHHEDWPEVAEIIEKETGVPVITVRCTEWS